MKRACRPTHPASANKTKSYAPKICSVVLHAISVGFSATFNSEAEHTAVTLQKDTRSLIFPFIQNCHVICISLPRGQPERQEMKSMPCLCTRCYFISMGTTDVAVNLIYEKATENESTTARWRNS